MTTPLNNQTKPLVESTNFPRPTKLQARSGTVKERKLEEEAKSHKKEMDYYLNLKTTKSRTQGLATPEERAEYTKRMLERSVTSEEKLKDSMNNLMRNAGPDTRTPDEVLHDVAVTSNALSTFE